MNLVTRAVYQRVINGAFAFILAIGSITALTPFIFSLRAGAVGTSTVTVNGNTSVGENVLGWQFNRDVRNVTPFAFTTDAASIGEGSLFVAPIGTNPADKFVGEHFVQTPIADVTSLSIDYKLGAATNANQVYFNVYANYGSSSLTKFYDCRYDVIASVGSTSSFSTLTFDPNASYAVRNGNGVSNCPSVPAQMNTISAGSTIRMYSVNFGDTSANDAGMSAYFDRAAVSKTSGVTVYDFEPIPVDTSSTTFIGDPRYVRENNASDVKAQIVTPDTTQNVRFYVNGDTSTTYPGVNIGGAGATTSWWRMLAPLSAGAYEVFAEVQVGNKWYSVADTGIVYSLDQPTGEYILPNAANQPFRPSDNPVRVKADDQYSQFSRMVIRVNGVNYEVTRANCDLRSAGSYVLCDVDNATNWTGLSDGTYTASTTIYTKANNRLDNLVSQPFMIDGSKPVISNLSVPAGVLGNSFTVSAEATDAQSGVESINFYITEPRASDGACTGNGTVLFASRVTVGTNGVYSHTFNNTGLNGAYCVNAIARNNAFGNSDILRQLVQIDTTAPVVTIDALATPVVAGATVTFTGTVTGDYSQLRLIFNGVAYDVVDIIGDVWSFTFDTTGLLVNNYDVEINAADAAGNGSASDPMTTMTTLAVVAPAPAPAPDNEEDSEEVLGTDTNEPNTTPLAGRAPQTTNFGSVLGTATPEDDSQAAESAPQGEPDVAGAAIDVLAQADTDTTDGTFLGLAWYWWVLIVGGLAALIGWIIAATRRRAGDA